MKLKYIKLILCMILISAISLHVSFANADTLVLKKGMSGEKVLELQQDLKKLGFFKESPTGYFGGKTEEAVIAFQKQYKLSPDGKVGNSTYAQLNKLLKKETVSSLSNSSVKIILDPGHGGIDAGTSKNGVIEKEVTLSIAKKAKAYLEEKGYSVIMTRSSDISLYKQSNEGSTWERRDLNTRKNIINNSGAKLFVSIHVNSLPEYPSISGSIVYYFGNNSKTRDLARSVQRSLNSITVNNKKRTFNNSQHNDFYLLKNTKISGILVETAFITNKHENSLLKTEPFKDKLAKGIVDGILNSSLMKK